MIDFLAMGSWLPGEIDLARAPSTRRIVPEIEVKIDAAWSAGRIRIPKLFDGPMCRLEMLEASEDRLRVSVSPTSYKIFYGTNLAQDAAELPREAMANPIGLSSALVTADGFLVFGRRNMSVAYYPGRIHPFAGALEFSDESPFAGLRRELQEELSLSEADLGQPVCLGVAEDRRLRQPEFIFQLNSRLSLADLQAQLNPDEHDAVHAVPATAEMVYSAEFTPIGAATLLLYGRRAFGQGWFAARTAALSLF